MRQTINTIKKSFLWWLVFLITVWWWAFVYASLSHVSSGNTLTASMFNDVIDATVPTWWISLYWASSAPNGWLLADGSAVSRTTYADLFAVIGTTYGVGDGSTTFNLPNFQWRVPLWTSGTYGMWTIWWNATQDISHTHAHNITNIWSCPSGWKFRDRQDCSYGHGWNYLNGTQTWGSASLDILNPYTVVNYIIKY